MAFFVQVDAIEMSKSSRFVPLLLVVVMLSLAGTWQLGQYARDWSMRQLKTEGEDRLLDTVSEIRLLLARFRYLPFLISQNKDVHTLLKAQTPNQVETVSRFLEQTNLVAGSTAQFVLNREGWPVAFSNWREQQDFYQVSHSASPYFQQALKGDQGLYIAIPEGPFRGAFYLSAPVYAAGNFAGAATVRVDLSQLRPDLPQVRDYLLSLQDKILLASQTKWQQRPMAEVLKAAQVQQLSDGSTVELRYLPDGQRVLSQSVLLDDLGWRVTVLSDISTAQRVGRTAVLYGLGGSVALLLLLLYLRERHLKNLSRQETRQALERNARQQRRIINTTQVGMITLDAQGRITFINPMARQQFGAEMSQLLQQPITALIADQPEQQSLRAALVSLPSASFTPITALESVALRQDGRTFPMLFSLKPMEQGVNATYLVTVIDITPRKRAEKALQRANDQLEHKVKERTRALEEAQSELVQAEKMAALGRMSSALVHELNQPLTALRTYIAISRALIAREETVQLGQNLDLIDDLTGRMAQMTRQLKTFAFKKPEQLITLDLVTALDPVLQLFAETFRQQQIDVVYERPTEPIYVAADNARIEQVLTNLITNACDAVAEVAAPRLVLTLTADSDMGRFSLQDNGCGLADPSQLFEPFYTTKKMGEGLGLGLSIVRTIVRDLDGTIQASNRPEGGACFTLLLPLIKERPE